MANGRFAVASDPAQETAFPIPHVVSPEEAKELEMELRIELTEVGFTPRQMVEVVHALLAGTRGIALSTHRPVLPTVLATIGSAMRSWSAGRLPAKDPWLRPGEEMRSGCLVQGPAVPSLGRSGRPASGAATRRSTRPCGPRPAASSRPRATGS